MAITLQTLVDTACLLAGPAGLKRGPDAELLVPHILIWVGQRAAADPMRRALVMETHTLTLVNGEAPLPVNVLIKHMDSAAVADPADPDMARQMRWIPDWSEFIRPLDDSLGYFTVVDGIFLGKPLRMFHLTLPGQVYTPGVGMNGDIELTTPSYPTIVDDKLTAASEIEREVVTGLAAALKGGWEAIAIAENSK
jgi:hypothetical protein